MSVSLKWSGLEELRRELRNLPDELKGEAGHIVEGVANGVGMTVRQHYPHGKTGNLIGGVHVTHFDKGKFSVGAIVKSSAPHAWIYEHGTTERHYWSQRNARHRTGKMQAAPESRRMIPVVIRARKRMYEQLADMLRRYGFLVKAA